MRLPRLILAAVLILVPTLGGAVNPGLTHCGIMSGLTSDQLDFASAMAFMSDRQRQAALGTSDLMERISRCAAQVREQICSPKIIMGLLKPGAPNVGGAALFAAPGVLSRDAGAALSGGAFGWTVGGVVGSAAQAKQCSQDRDALTLIADRLDGAVRLLAQPQQPAQLQQNLSYQGFVAMLQQNAPRRLTIEEGDRLAKAANATRNAVSAAVR